LWRNAIYPRVFDDAKPWVRLLGEDHVSTVAIWLDAGWTAYVAVEAAVYCGLRPAEAEATIEAHGGDPQKSVQTGRCAGGQWDGESLLEVFEDARKEGKTKHSQRLVR
jgi:hypothetical protein